MGLTDFLFRRRKKRIGAKPMETTLAHKRTAMRLVKRHLYTQPGSTLIKIAEDTDVSSIVVWGVLQKLQADGEVGSSCGLYWYLT